MRNDLLKILGLDENATEREIDDKYYKLRDEYRNDMFAEGEKGNEAAKKLTELESAYSELKSEISYSAKENVSYVEANSDDSVYERVEQLVKDGDINKAQEILDDREIRNAKWHYYQAMVFYKKDWYTDSKKQLELALKEDPDNQKYKTAYERLVNRMSGGDKKKTEEKQTERKQQSNEWWKGDEEYSPEGSPDWEDNNRQMGGCQEAMDCCTQLLCINLFCNCVGGGC